jgi:hypothetical protein
MKADGVTNQLLLYAKHHYGKSNEACYSAEGMIKDIETIICKYCGIEDVLQRDIYDIVCRAFAECFVNKYQLGEALLEIVGKKWDGNMIKNRHPIQVMIGNLAIADGEWVDMAEKMDFHF